MNGDKLRCTIDEVLNPIAQTNTKYIINRINNRYIQEFEGHWLLKNPINNDINFFLRRKEAAECDGVGHYISLRRLIYILHRGSIPKRRRITNSCGLPTCVAPKHLKFMSKDAVVGIEE